MHSHANGSTFVNANGSTSSNATSLLLPCSCKCYCKQRRIVPEVLKLILAIQLRQGQANTTVQLLLILLLLLQPCLSSWDAQGVTPTHILVSSFLFMTNDPLQKDVSYFSLSKKNQPIILAEKLADGALFGVCRFLGLKYR